VCVLGKRKNWLNSFFYLAGGKGEGGEGKGDFF
jgi:hypothetical protein